MSFVNMRCSMETVNNELKRVGFSQPEIQVYIEVLKEFPITGYELSERSEIPRTMIYEVIANLLKKEAVYTATLVPLTYVPLPAEELINRLR